MAEVHNSTTFALHDMLTAVYRFFASYRSFSYALSQEKQSAAARQHFSRYAKEVQ